MDILYIHSASLKKAGGRYGILKLLLLLPISWVTYVLSCREKMNSCKVKSEQAFFPIKHTANNNFTDCRMAVVLKVPISCGRFYVGQTACCISDIN